MQPFPADGQRRFIARVKLAAAALKHRSKPLHLLTLLCFICVNKGQGIAKEEPFKSKRTELYCGHGNGGRGRRGGGTAEHSHGLSPSTAAPSAEDAHSKQEPQSPARSPQCSAGGDLPSFCFIFFNIKRGIKKSLKKILIVLMFVTRGTLRGLRKQRGGAERGSEQQGHNQAGPNAVHTVLRRAALSALK